MSNLQLARLLTSAGYKGFLAVEIDFLHPDYLGDEDGAVAQSIHELKRIAAVVEMERTTGAAEEMNFVKGTAFRPYVKS